jgi:hypothetical protein
MKILILSERTRGAIAGALLRFDSAHRFWHTAEDSNGIGPGRLSGIQKWGWAMTVTLTAVTFLMVARELKLRRQ